MGRELKQYQAYLESLDMSELSILVQKSYNIINWADLQKDELIESIILVETNNYFK